MRSILIIICLVFYISAVFVVTDHSNIDDRVSKSVVLGVSEVSAQEEAVQIVSNGFPESAEYKIPVPHKLNDFNIDLNCLGVVVDDRTGDVLFEQDANRQVPIASITKLATALTFLDFGLDWESTYTISDRDRVNGGKVYLYRGDEVRLKDLFYLSLVGSANTATKALVYSTGLSEKEFVHKMNLKMKEIGLVNTSFEDVVGLSKNNVSTAFEVAELARKVFERDEVREVTLTSVYEFETKQGKKKIVYSTDALLDELSSNDFSINGGKTGFTDLAGYCFVGKFVNQDGQEVTSVVLGSDNINSRFSDTKKLVKGIYENYSWW